MLEKASKFKVDSDMIELLSHMLERDRRQRWSSAECLSFCQEKFQIQDPKEVIKNHVSGVFGMKSQSRQQQVKTPVPVPTTMKGEEVRSTRMALRQRKTEE